MIFDNVESHENHKKKNKELRKSRSDNNANYLKLKILWEDYETY